MFIGHDLGTSSDKAVLVTADGEVLATAKADYPLAHPRPDWVEQDPADWWDAVCQTTAELTDTAGIAVDDLQGLCFAGQMLALVPLDEAGEPTRPAISWMDARAARQARKLIRRFGGERILASLAGGTPSGKDLIPKIAWIERNEPEVFQRTHAFCDATGYLVAQATGRVRMDPTAAGGTGVYTAKNRQWSRLLAKLSGFPLHKMAPIVPSDVRAGVVTEAAAERLGVAPGLPVAMGMADIPASAIGSGAVLSGQAHLYLGTSAWIGVTVDRPKAVPRAGIASVPSADRSGCLMIGESETAGACRDWLQKNLEVGIEEVDDLAGRSPPGANGLIFCPWMHGERSPRADEHVRGAFINLGLSHTRADMARAVLEGVALNLRWTLDEMAAIDEPCPTLRAIGGGAQSELWLQIIANVTGRQLERVARPRLAGAIGAALVAAVAAGTLAGIQDIASRVHVDSRYQPDSGLSRIYSERLSTFKAAFSPLASLGVRR